MKNKEDFLKKCINNEDIIKLFSDENERYNYCEKEWINNIKADIINERKSIIDNNKPILK